jgi:hypothetical protein
MRSMATRHYCSAVMVGDTTIVQQLLDAGCDKDKRIMDGYTALQYAVASVACGEMDGLDPSRQVQVVKLLLKAGCQSTDLTDLIERLDLELIERLEEEYTPNGLAVCRALTEGRRLLLVYRRAPLLVSEMRLLLARAMAQSGVHCKAPDQALIRGSPRARATV